MAHVTVPKTLPGRSLANTNFLECSEIPLSWEKLTEVGVAARSVPVVKNPLETAVRKWPDLDPMPGSVPFPAEYCIPRGGTLEGLLCDHALYPGGGALNRERRMPRQRGSSRKS